MSAGPPGAGLRVTRRTAPLTCPSCGHEFTGCWLDGKTGGQQCPACEHVFEAAWPGFTFEPEVVIVGAGDGEGDG